MEDFDLNSVWKNSDEQADKFYRSVEPEVLEMARKYSTSVLDRIRKNVIGEWVSTLIIFAGLIIYGHMLGHFWFVVGVSAVLLGLTWVPYSQMLKKIGEAPSKNLVESLETKIKVLELFIKRLKFLMWVLKYSPLSFTYVSGYGFVLIYYKILRNSLMYSLL